jgi:hypothetical protein
MTQAIEWVAYQGRLLYDPNGNAIGTIEEFYIDRDDGQPVWALVYTEPAGMRLAFVPLREAQTHGNGVKRSAWLHRLTSPSRSMWLRARRAPRSRPSRISDVI